METIIPKTSTVLSALMKADFTTQWRNRRSVVMVLLVPLILLVSWKGLVKVAGAPFVLANAITFGLIAIGLMGYSNSIARDRDKGIFQRLRVAPLPSWAIMSSRLVVQMAMIMILVTIVFIVGHNYDKATLSVEEYILTYCTAIVGGAVYMAL
jgi:ABC-2 type transport system permease protein